MQALNTQAQRILKLFGHEKPSMVVSYAGAEQEYFLIDKNFFYARPDLLNAGRALFGAKPPKGQEFEDHYFGVIPDRVIAYMSECDRELFKLGVPVKTRHNEVAPGQFEVAPVFESSNLASDHQQMVMTVLKQVAEKHGFVCLLHEKPFTGVNGSGKHVNFSFGNATQGNLLDPGETPHDNAQFLVFCGAVIRAVHKYAGLLRAVIATAANDHRLGANEAPPAIISIFLGSQLSDVFEQIKTGGAKSSKMGGVMEIGVDSLPKLPRDAGDRNRTSPFAFTGNRFEFRAVGSSQSISDALVALNTIIAESCDVIATKLEAAVASGKKLNAAIQEVLAEIISKHGAVVFDGNGYSTEWHNEAEKRGLPNYKTAVDAIPVFEQKDVIGVFDKYKVLSPRERHRPLRDVPRAVLQDGERGGEPHDEDREDVDLPGGRALPARAGQDGDGPQRGGLHARHDRAQAGDRAGRQAGVEPGWARDGDVTPRRGGRARRGEALLHGGVARHAQGARGRRRARGHRRRRAVAAADVPRDPLHQVDLRRRHATTIVSRASR